METILKIKVLRGGTQGATITFKKNEIKSGMTFENGVDKDFTWPVQGAFKKDMEKLGPILCKIMDLKDAKGYIGTEIEYGSKGYVIKAQKLFHYSGKTYVGDFKSIPVNPEHPLFNEVNEHFIKIKEHIADYASTETRVDTRQLIMDLKEEGKLKLPEGLENIEIEDVTDEDLLKKFGEALQKAGRIVIEAEDTDESNEVIEPIVEERPIRKLASATA